MLIKRNKFCSEGGLFDNYPQGGYDMLLYCQKAKRGLGKIFPQAFGVIARSPRGAEPLWGVSAGLLRDKREISLKLLFTRQGIDQAIANDAGVVQW